MNTKTFLCWLSCLLLAGAWTMEENYTASSAYVAAALVISALSKRED